MPQFWEPGDVSELEIAITHMRDCQRASEQLVVDCRNDILTFQKQLREKRGAGVERFPVVPHCCDAAHGWQMHIVGFSKKTVTFADRTGQTWVKSRRGGCDLEKGKPSGRAQMATPSEIEAGIAALVAMTN